MSDDVLDRPEVAALYALDPSAFVGARNAVVAELKAAGDTEGAKVVGALKKPTKVAWAINQVAHAQPAMIDDLRAAGAELRERQADALAGGDADALRAATATRRDIVRALATEAVALAGDGAREAAAATFEAASLDEGVGAVLAAGRLTTAVDRPADLGFPGGFGLGVASSTRDTAARSDASRSDTPSTGESAEPIQLDRRRITRLEKRLATAQDAADEAGGTATQAVERRTQAAAAAAEARDALAAAQEASTSAEEELAAADRGVARAQDAAARADAATEEIRIELDRLRG